MKNGNGFFLSGSLVSVCNVHVILVNPFNTKDEKSQYRDLFVSHDMNISGYTNTNIVVQ